MFPFSPDVFLFIVFFITLCRTPGNTLHLYEHHLSSHNDMTNSAITSEKAKYAAATALYKRLKASTDPSQYGPHTGDILPDKRMSDAQSPLAVARDKAVKEAENASEVFRSLPNEDPTVIQTRLARESIHTLKVRSDRLASALPRLPPQKTKSQPDHPIVTALKMKSEKKS